MSSQYILPVDDSRRETLQSQPNQATPPALMFSSRRLLTEKSLVKVNQHPLAMVTETFAVRATVVTAILKEIPGYYHFGIND